MIEAPRAVEWLAHRDADDSAQGDPGALRGPRPALEVSDVGIPLPEALAADR